MQVSDSELSAIRNRYERGLYRQAYDLALQYGPLRQWVGPRARVLAARVARHVGAPRLARWHIVKAWREDPADADVRYYFALESLELPEAAWWDQLHRIDAALVAHQRQAAEQFDRALQADAPGHRLSLEARLRLAQYDASPADRATALDGEAATAQDFMARVDRARLNGDDLFLAAIVDAVLGMRTAESAARRGTFEAVRDHLREAVQKHRSDLEGDRARCRAVRLIGSLRGGVVGAAWRIVARFRL
jgi:hypothetical protein